METISFYYNRLPHWEVDRGIYFVTVCEHGAIPRDAANEIRRYAVSLQQVKSQSAYWNLQRRIFGAMERALDAGHGQCYLQRPEVATMLIEAIRNRCARAQWDMGEYVVMPNHLHLFFQLTDKNLRRVMIDFKRWTGAQGLALTGAQAHHFWHEDWYDHWSRSAHEDEGICEYIRQNPVKAGLVKDYRDWPYGSWRDR